MGQTNDSHQRKWFFLHHSYPLIRYGSLIITFKPTIGCKKINLLFVNIGFDVISQIMAWKIQKPELKYEISGLFKRNNTC